MALSNIPNPQIVGGIEWSGIPPPAIIHNMNTYTDRRRADAQTDTQLRPLYHPDGGYFTTRSRTSDRQYRIDLVWAFGRYTLTCECKAGQTRRNQIPCTHTAKTALVLQGLGLLKWDDKTDSYLPHPDAAASQHVKMLPHELCPTCDTAAYLAHEGHDCPNAGDVDPFEGLGF